jgi:hypothetical protein
MLLDCFMGGGEALLLHRLGLRQCRLRYRLGLFQGCLCFELRFRLR